MQKLLCASAALIVSLSAACDGCGQKPAAPSVRLDQDEEPSQLDGAGGASNSCGELSPCDSDDSEDEDLGDSGDGEGEPPPPPPVCRNQTFTNSERIPPRILLVVDKSGSMANAVGQDYPVSKWAATKSTIVDVVSDLDRTASFGLMMFPGKDVDANLCTSGDEYVPMQENAAFAIAQSLDLVTEPRGATPTAASLRDAKEILDALPAQGGTRAVVLATDGGPNCNASLDGALCRCTPNTHCGPNNPDTATYMAPANCIDDDDAVASTRALNDAGYPVFVVGIPGINGFEDVMNSLSDAGGTARAGAIRYYDASTSTELAHALESATFRVSTCRFDLSAPAAAPEDVTVRIDGAAVAQDPNRSAGWDLVDDDTVELFGAACMNGASSANGVVITVCN